MTEKRFIIKVADRRGWAARAVAALWVSALWAAALLLAMSCGGVWRAVVWCLLGGKGLMLISTAVAIVLQPGQGWRVFAGRYRFDSHSRHGMAQAATRFGWELPQTAVGYLLAQWRVASRRVTTLEVLDGATFVVGRHRDPYTSAGMTLGCFVHMWLPRGREQDFELYARQGRDNLARHEYGHTVDSQVWGWLYLPVVGVPSLVSQWLALGRRPRHRHETFWVERRADRLGRRYFASTAEPECPKEAQG